LISEEQKHKVHLRKGLNIILIKSVNHWMDDWSFHVSMANP
jgi:hypothetical protein